MEELMRKAKEIGTYWKRTLMEKFKKEIAEEANLAKKDKKMCRQSRMDDTNAEISYHPSVPRADCDNILNEGSSFFSVLSSKYFSFYSPKHVKQEDEIKETPSTEGQLEGDEFKASFRFDVKYPADDLPEPTDLRAWRLRVAIPPSYCPFYGRDICPTQQNFYVLEFSDDSDLVEVRRREGTKLAVWHEGSLVPVPKAYGYWNDSTSSTHG